MKKLWRNITAKMQKQTFLPQHQRILIFFFLCLELAVKVVFLLLSPNRKKMSLVLFKETLRYCFP